MTTHSQKTRHWQQAAAGFIVPLLLVAIWQTVCSLGWVNQHVLPSPWAVVTRWLAYLLPAKPYAEIGGNWLGWALSGELIVDASGSMYRVLVGFLVGALLALPLGLLMGASTRIYAWLNPLAQVLRPIPPIAYIPLAILWFGLGNPPAIFLISIGAFFPVLINTIAGVRQVDGIYLRAARNLGPASARCFCASYCRLRCPTSSPACALASAPLLLWSSSPR